MLQALILTALSLFGAAASNVGGGPVASWTVTVWTPVQDWSGSSMAVLPSWNPKVGALLSVDLQLGLYMESGVAGENISPSAAGVVCWSAFTSSSSRIDLPGARPPVRVEDLGGEVCNEGAVFDGVLNFDGPSGASETWTAFERSPFVMSLTDVDRFSGRVPVPIRSTLSIAPGPIQGNTVAAFTTKIAHEVRATYYFLPQ